MKAISFQRVISLEFRNYVRFSDTVNFVTLYALNFIILCALYLCFIGPLYEYTGFTISENKYHFIIGFLAILIWALMTPKKPDVRGLFINLLGSVFLLPSLVLYGVGGFDGWSALLIYASAILVALASSVPIPRLIFLEISPKTLMYIILGIIVVTVMAMMRNGGPLNFDLSKVYEFRERESGVLGYISSALSKSLVPFAVALSLKYRKWVSYGLVVVGSILLFGIASHKTMLFAPFFATGIYFVVARFRNSSAILFALSAVLIVSLVDVWLFWATDGEFYSGWMTSLLVRRALMVPALLNYYYADFFNGDTAYFYWANSKFSLGLVDQPYDLAAPFLIGREYLGNASTSANVGFFGSGIAEAGIAGVALYSIILGFLISFLNSNGKALGRPLVVTSMLMLVATAILSTSLTTLLLTHGLLVAILLLMIVARTPTQLGMTSPAKLEHA